jgi:hypothetical protein
LHTGDFFAHPKPSQLEKCFDSVWATRGRERFALALQIYVRVN